MVSLSSRTFVSSATLHAERVQDLRAQTALIAGIMHQRMMKVCAFATADTSSSKIFVNSATLHVPHVQDHQAQTASIAGITPQRMMKACALATTDTSSSQIFVNCATLHVVHVRGLRARTASIAGITRPRTMTVFAFATTDTSNRQMVVNSVMLHAERVQELRLQTALIVGMIQRKLSEELVNVRATTLGQLLRKTVVKNVMHLVKNVPQLELLAVQTAILMLLLTPLTHVYVTRDGMVLRRTARSATRNA